RRLLEEAPRSGLDADVDVARAVRIGTRRHERVLVIEEADAEHLVVRRDDAHLGHAQTTQEPLAGSAQRSIRFAARSIRRTARNTSSNGGSVAICEPRRALHSFL